MTDSSHELQVKKYDAAVKALNVELDLFWKRSTFFWGFIAASFIVLGNIHQNQPHLALAVASIGFVFSVGWTLLNRGNKYWQEQWENKVFSAESDVTGPLYDSELAPKFRKSQWLRGVRFSPSRLSIAMSDYVAGIWFLMILGEGWRIVSADTYSHTRPIASLTFAVLSVLYAIAVAVQAKSRYYSEPQQRRSPRT